MIWSISLCLLLLGAHESIQDMVTIAPSESGTTALPPVSEEVSETPSLEVVLQKSKERPTIRAFHVLSDIKYRYATTLVSSRVINPSGEAAEASFLVTLPESAFISEFLMDVKGKVYKAYVKEKKEAKAEYDEAVQAGQFAGHVALDARDSNQFTVSVNIEAHGKVTFNLTYEQLLPRTLGEYINVVNINPQQIVDDMSVTVNIEEPSEIINLEVPELQDVSNEAIQDSTTKNELAKIEVISPNHTQVVWAPTPEQQRAQNKTGLSGQFIVKYDVNREANPQQILVDEGYFVHFFAPENLPKLRKHVVFVLDYSGSMAGRKLEQLKDAMKKILSDLDPKDYFSIVIFQSYVEAWSPNRTYSSSLEFLSQWEIDRMPQNSINVTLDKQFVVPASEDNLKLARAYMANYSDLGATNIMGGLRTGLELVKIGADDWTNESEAPQPMVVFLTDGQPNVEEYDPDTIVNKTKPLNTNGCPIFSLAFGYGADFNFLRKLSLSNNGFARNIYEAADASDQLKNFYKTIASPLLSNITFSYLPGQVDNNSTNTTRKEFPVFFKGSEIVVAGQIDKDVKENANIGALIVSTAEGVKKYNMIIDIVLKPQNRSSSPIGHLEKSWAYLKIKQLLDKSDSVDDMKEKNETKEKALELALQYSFVTPLTSLVVVKPNKTESSVGTTQVKPGSGSGSLQPLSASLGSQNFASAAYGGAAPQYAMYPSHLSAPAAAGGFSGGFAGASYSPSNGRSIVQHSWLRSGYYSSNPRLSSRVFAPRFQPSYGFRAPPPSRLVTHKTSGKLSMKNHQQFGPPAHPSFLSTRAPVPAMPPSASNSMPMEMSELDSAGLSTLFSVESTTQLEEGVQQKKVSVSEVKWLPQPLASNATVTVQGHNYYLGLNQTDVSFGNCTVNSQSGECHHMEHCALKVFTDAIDDFLPYQCKITGDFLGVCCPLNAA